MCVPKGESWTKRVLHAIWLENYSPSWKWIYEFGWTSKICYITMIEGFNYMLFKNICDYIWSPPRIIIDQSRPLCCSYLTSQAHPWPGSTMVLPIYATWDGPICRNSHTTSNWRIFIIIVVFWVCSSLRISSSFCNAEHVRKLMYNFCYAYLHRINDIPLKR